MLMKLWWWCIFANSESSDLALSPTCLFVCAWPFPSPIDFPPFSSSFFLSSIDQICISLQIISFTKLASSFYFSIIQFLPRPNISILQMFSFFQCFPVFYFSISFTIFDQIFSFSVFLFICWPNIILLSIFLLKYFTRSSHSSPKIEEEKNEFAPKFHSDDFPILHNYFNLCRS